MFTRIIRAVLGSVLLPLAGFCLFGFAATFEPTSDPHQFLGFRIVYALVGLGSLAGLGMLIASGARRSREEETDQ